MDCSKIVVGGIMSGSRSAPAPQPMSSTYARQHSTARSTIPVIQLRVTKGHKRMMCDLRSVHLDHAGHPWPIAASASTTYHHRLRYCYLISSVSPLIRRTTYSGAKVTPVRSSTSTIDTSGISFGIRLLSPKMGEMPCPTPMPQTRRLKKIKKKEKKDQKREGGWMTPPKKT